MITALAAALVLLASPKAAPAPKPPTEPKVTGASKVLVGAWYQGDTQYLDLTDTGQGRLGMLEMTWKVDKPNNLHLVFKEDGAEKDLPFKLAKGVLTMEVQTREVVLKKGVAKVKPKVGDAAEAPKDPKASKKPSK